MTMTDTENSTALIIGRDFSCAVYAASDESLIAGWREKGPELINHIREKIGQLDWDNLDTSSHEAYELFPVLVAVANVTSEGRQFLREFGGETIWRYATGQSYPSEGYSASYIFNGLKPIVENALDALEARLIPSENTLTPQFH